MKNFKLSPLFLRNFQVECFLNALRQGRDMRDSITVKFQTKKFNRSLIMWRKRFRGNLANAIKEIATRIHERLLSSAAQGGTPVDTGVARSAWRLHSISNIAYKLINNTPYIRVLEFGGYRGKGPKTTTGKSPYTKNYVSKQAPRGMVRLSLRDGAKELRRMWNGS